MRSRKELDDLIQSRIDDLTGSASRNTPVEGDRVRVSFDGSPHPGWMSGEVMQSNPRKQRCIVRWDTDKMTDLVDWARITILRAKS